jgi:hypothetical protein
MNESQTTDLSPLLPRRRVPALRVPLAGGGAYSTSPAKGRSTLSAAASCRMLCGSPQALCGSPQALLTSAGNGKTNALTGWHP